jgi:hypothetical protein
LTNLRTHGKIADEEQKATMRSSGGKPTTCRVIFGGRRLLLVTLVLCALVDQCRAFQARGLIMKKCYLLSLLVILVVTLPTLGLGQDAYIQMRECMLAENGVLYYFWACAGVDAVNDIEICLFDADGNALDFLSISAPPCWYPHASGNCGYWYTEENPISPGECLDEFDFKVPPGNCFILVRWQFTYDGVPVTDWQDTWFTCHYTDTEVKTWSSIKSLYR